MFGHENHARQEIIPHGREVAVFTAVGAAGILGAVAAKEARHYFKFREQERLGEVRRQLAEQMSGDAGLSPEQIGII